ncbi:4-oxalocrotonate tautomerase [Mycobacterium spongiae]|uniref:4-oxalocrotonate tautomerase n=1 Tax=Mycobacterium spongiae TaxID=886343 RepID=A0A975JVH8_9MYCO|nr:4-oxalocrotonate tautomerase [Mycobacterium spongiae]QUR66095.1 4-oxalocrotonate tautomerase [Mycobacterium spongiae]
MPLYTVSTRRPLPLDVRESVAMMITDVHCEHTGAPRTFVNVYYSHNVPLRPGIELDVFGSVRGGRTLQTNDNVEDDMVDQLAKLTGIAPSRIDFSIFPVPASWIMEGGVVLPEPGEEDSWLKEHGHAAK